MPSYPSKSPYVKHTGHEMNDKISLMRQHLASRAIK